MGGINTHMDAIGRYCAAGSIGGPVLFCVGRKGICHVKSFMECIVRNLRLFVIVGLIAAAIILPKELENAFLNERVVTMTDAVDMLAAGVEAEPARPWFDHELNIRDAVEHLDRVEQVYAAAFKVVGGRPVRFTERHYETSPFEPFSYAELEDAIQCRDYGHVIITYTPEGQQVRDIHVYFRWMPLYSEAGEKYLVVTGVSKYSIVSNAYVLLSVGLWVLTVYTAAVTVRSIMRSAQADGEPEGKSGRNGGGRHRKV